MKYYRVARFSSFDDRLIAFVDAMYKCHVKPIQIVHAATMPDQDGILPVASIAVISNGFERYEISLWGDACIEIWATIFLR